MGRSLLAGMDLNLLVALDALLRERSVTRAAARLGLTQSAMSRALDRLRTQFDDPILVRRGAEMVPTPLANELVAPLAGALEEIGRLFTRRSTFNPARDARRFSILASDYAQAVVLPSLTKRIREVAPNIDLRVRSRAHPERSLAEEDIDLMVGPLRAELPTLYRQRLFVDRLVCVARAGHPAFGAGLDLERYLEALHVLVAPRGLPGGFVDDALTKRGLERRVVVEVPHFLVAPLLVADSDLILTIPERLAEILRQRFAVAIAPAPLELPPIEFFQAWHARNHEDAAHEWLRLQVRETS